MATWSLQYCFVTMVMYVFMVAEVVEVATVTRSKCKSISFAIDLIIGTGTFFCGASFCINIIHLTLCLIMVLLSVWSVASSLLSVRSEAASSLLLSSISSASSPIHCDHLTSIQLITVPQFPGVDRGQWSRWKVEYDSEIL